MMNEVAFEMTLHSRSPEAIAWFDAALVPSLTAAAGRGDLVLYRPEAGKAADPHNDDGAPWPRLVMVSFGDIAAWRAFARSEDFIAALASRGEGTDLTANVFERLVYSDSDGTSPGLSVPTFSYVVRYSGSGLAAIEFRDDYLQTHHHWLLQLPAIRAVMNFMPLDEPLPAGLRHAPYVIGNEVVFDDLAAFNVAMASPPRQAMREAFLAGPKSPDSVHFPMTRTLVKARH